MASAAEKVAELTLAVEADGELRIALDGVLSGIAIGAALQALGELEAMLRTSVSLSGVTA